MEFKDRLRALREERKISAAHLASAFDKSEGAVRMWETGRTKPDADTLIELAKYFDCTTDYLLGLSELKNSTDKIRLEGQFELITRELEKIPKVSMLDMALYTIYHYVGFWRIDIQDDELQELLYLRLSHLVQELSMLPTTLPATQSVFDQVGDDPQRLNEILLTSLPESMRGDRNQIEELLEKYISQIEVAVYALFGAGENKLLDRTIEASRKKMLSYDSDSRARDGEPDAET